VQFPVTRIFLGLGILFAALMLTQSALDLIPGIHQGVPEVLPAAAVALTALLAYIVPTSSTRRKSRATMRAPIRSSRAPCRNAPPTALFTATIGLISLFGFYHVSGFNPWTVLLPALSLSIVSGVVEEVLVRGILFRIMEEALGTWLALAISALLFGWMHISNPNATLWSALAIAIEAGIMLAAAFIFTRRLWLAIGIHFAWNFVQGGIFGVAVSGNGVQGLLQSTLDGPPLLSGGAFGAEASIFAVIVCLAAGIYLTWSAWKKGNFIQPFWTK